MERPDVYKLIDGEREHQGQKWDFEHDKNHSPADWLIFMEKYLENAKHEIWQLDYDAALDNMRIIAALAVACMEHNETRPRNTN